MEKKTNAYLFIVLLPFFWFLSCSDAESQDEVIVWVQLDVTHIYENQFKLGDPPVTGNFVTEVSFTRYGFYTITRHGDGEFMALPGMGSSVKMPETLNLGIQQSHPCQDGQSLVIGHASKALNGRVHPASGWIEAKASGKNRLRLHLLPTEITDVDHFECTTQYCNNGFGFSYGMGNIGWDREASEEEDEYGYVENFGYDLIELDFQLLKDIAEGGELTLAIPISIHEVYQHDYEDPPGYAAREMITYRVNGVISKVPSHDFDY